MHVGNKRHSVKGILQEVQDNNDSRKNPYHLQLIHRAGETRGQEEDLGCMSNLRDRRTGSGAAGFTLGAPAAGDPGVSGFRRQRPRPVPVPVAAGVADWLKRLARSRRPICCMRSMFSRILASLSRSYPSAAAVSGDTGDGLLGASASASRALAGRPRGLGCAGDGSAVAMIRVAWRAGWWCGGEGFGGEKGRRRRRKPRSPTVRRLWDFGSAQARWIIRPSGAVMRPLVFTLTRARMTVVDFLP
jgi:hypothetical protein